MRWGDEEDPKWSKKFKARFGQITKRRIVIATRYRVISEGNRGFEEVEVWWLALIISIIEGEYKNKGDNGWCERLDGYPIYRERRDKSRKRGWLCREEVNSRGELDLRGPSPHVRRAKRPTWPGDKQF